MADEQTIKYVEANKAALADFLRKPIALEEWDSEVADGMLRFKERVKTKAKEQGSYILVAGGIGQEYYQNRLHNGLVDICGFFALEAPKLRGGLPEHKYMVLTPACNDPHSPILIVGTPVGIYQFHKEIVKDLTDCLGLDVRQWGGGYYEGFCPKGKGSPAKSRVYGKSQDFGEFIMPEVVAGMLDKLKFNLDQNQDALQQQRRQTERLLKLTPEEMNAEIIKRVEPWLAYITGESDKVPLDYSRDPEFPDMQLFEWEGYDKYYNIVNMNHSLALSAGFRFEGNEITARFTGDMPKETARLIDIVAKNDIGGQTEEGQMSYMARTVGNLRKLNLLTRFVEEYAKPRIPESVRIFYDRQEEYWGRRNIQFNAKDTLADLAGTHIYDPVVAKLRELIDVERERRALRDEEMRWYQTFMKEAEENRRRE